jgi:mannose-1-phosphate guanylyltransferase
MQAIVLVGGEGTRLRPLTLTQPKPAVRLVDRPFIRFMLDWLERHGIDDVVMACGFRADALREVLGESPTGNRPGLRYLEEPVPLGTAGPIRLAADEGILADRFLVLNGDLLSDLDLTALIRAHSGQAVATIATHPVEDPASYGLVRRDGAGEVSEFLEKPDPAEIDTDELNAGAYVLERSIVDLIPAGRTVSIEREVFPKLVGNGLFARRLEGYWMDVGTPERYLRATWDILEGVVQTKVAERLDAAGLLVEDGAAVDASAAVSPPALIETGCEVAADAEIGARAVLGSGSGVGEAATVVESVLDRDCRIGARAVVERAILAAGVEVGPGARIGSGAVIGEGATVASRARVSEDGRVQPGERVTSVSMDE